MAKREIEIREEKNNKGPLAQKKATRTWLQKGKNNKLKR